VKDKPKGLMVAIALGKGKHDEPAPEEEGDDKYDDDGDGDEDAAAYKDAARGVVDALGLDPGKLDMDKVTDALCTFADLHKEMTE
jgi:hypothetical protein